MDDAAIGSNLRAYAKAVKYIKNGFISLEKFRKVEEKKLKETLSNGYKEHKRNEHKGY
jgi:hypothetical protein